ncbi:MAG TPA: two-component regulator propeller domain-containing protein [Gammaproteobacteria bacterium]|nr:two-component regulator propeller domain-containing protein [Gammaproteobacteria bacterium]
MTVRNRLKTNVFYALLACTLASENTLSQESPKATTPTPPNAVAATPAGAKAPKWENVLTRAKVMSIAFEGHYLWLGLYGGALRHDMRTVKDHDLFTMKNTHGGFMSEGVYKITIAPDGAKWFGTYGGGLTKFDGKTWTNYTPEGYGVADKAHSWSSYKDGQGLGDMWVYDIAFDKNNTMWVATWKGASRFDGANNTFKTYHVAEGLADKWVYALGIDNNGICWFGTEGGVTRYDGKEWKSYTHKDGLGADLKEAIPGNPHIPSSSHHSDPKKGNLASNPNYVMSVAIDKDDNKWFGTWGSGLSRFDGKQWKTYTSADGLAGNFIFSLAVDKNGVLWAGTNKGVSRFDGKTWKSYSQKDGLLDDFVYSIGVDPENHKWFGTRVGVSKLIEAG